SFAHDGAADLSLLPGERALLHRVVGIHTAEQPRPQEAADERLERWLVDPPLPGADRVARPRFRCCGGAPELAGGEQLGGAQPHADAAAVLQMLVSRRAEPEDDGDGEHQRIVPARTRSGDGRVEGLEWGARGRARQEPTREQLVEELSQAI